MGRKVPFPSEFEQKLPRSNSIRVEVYHSPPSPSPCTWRASSPHYLVKQTEAFRERIETCRSLKSKPDPSLKKRRPLPSSPPSLKPSLEWKTGSHLLPPSLASSSIWPLYAWGYLSLSAHLFSTGCLFDRRLCSHLEVCIQGEWNQT